MSSLLFVLILSASTNMPNTAPPVDRKDLCFVENLCALKEAVRWKTPKWEQPMCNRVGNAIIAEERNTGIPKDFILSVMLHESDLNEKAVRPATRKGKLVAKDGGLMGLRCSVGNDEETCINYGGRIKASDLLVPEINIRLGVKKLLSIRDTYACTHIDHPWFAHYNWGGKVFRTGVPRSYPQRIAVLWKAIADTLGVHRPEIAKLRFVQVAGKKPVTINTPVGARHVTLIAKIRTCFKRTCGGDEVAAVPHVRTLSGGPASLSRLRGPVSYADSCSVGAAH